MATHAQMDASDRWEQALHIAQQAIDDLITASDELSDHLGIEHDPSLVVAQTLIVGHEHRSF